MENDQINVQKQNAIADFKINLPPKQKKYRFTDRHPKIEDADILTIGDSFFEYNRSTSFPELLGKATKSKVFYARRYFPLAFLEAKGYQKTEEEKLLIYQMGERAIALRLSVRHRPKRNSNRWKKRVKSVRDGIFPPKKKKRYAAVLERSRFTHKLYGQFETMRFRQLGYMSPNTPKYVLEPPILFYHKTVNQESTSYYYQHSQEEIDAYCDNLAELARQLKELYNIKLVFMPVPNKYTVYSKLLNDDPYNQLLPKVYTGAKERGVPVIDLYTPFLNSTEMLYYGTDTHWNANGVKLGLKTFLESADKQGFHVLVSQ